jgi:hypothetical protein
MATISPAATNIILQDRAITVLNAILGPLNAFTTNFNQARRRPKESVVVDVVANTDHSTVQTNPADFEVDNSTIAPVTVELNQYSVSFEMTNTHLQEGHLLANLVDASALALGRKIKGIAITPFATWEATSTIGPNGDGSIGGITQDSWGVAEAKHAWGQLRGAGESYLIMDRPYIANLQASDRQWFDIDKGRTGNSGAYGFDGIYNSEHWTEAHAADPGFEAVGIACHPQCIAAAAGLPDTPSGANFISQSTFVVPGLGLSVLQSQWFSLKTRSLWGSFDVMFGAEAGDHSAAIVLRSTTTGPA